MIDVAVLVTGGLGYIGSHTAVALAQGGADVVLLDNLRNSEEGAYGRVQELAGVGMPFYRADIGDEEELGRIIKKEGIRVVLHFAGLKAVGESSKIPLEYYRNNVGGTISLLQACVRGGVEGFVFSSSATVYDSSQPTPFAEGSKMAATNPYAYTKLMLEQVIRDTVGLKSVILRYFNPVGAHPSGIIGEAPRGIPNNLMPYICQAATGQLPRLQVFGTDYDTPDGSCIRDYIHVQDLARGHILAMERMREGAAVYNLGTGRGTSVLEMIASFEKATGVAVPFIATKRREGDAPISVACVEKAQRDLDFRAELDIEAMCRDAWNYQTKN